MTKILIDRSVVEQALEALDVATTPLAKDRQEVLLAKAALRAALAEPVQVVDEAAIHAAWSAGYVEGEKAALAQPEQEPFGYFRSEPFGWTDCAETDEGAVALYKQPPQRKPLRSVTYVCPVCAASLERQE